VLTSRNTYCLGLAMTCAAFLAYLLYFWYPTYLMEGRGVTNIRAAWLSASILVCGASGVLLGGWLGDWLTRRTGRRALVLRLMGSLGLLTGVPCVVGAIYSGPPEATTLLFAVAFFALNIQLAAWWAAVPDVAGPHVGALFGLLNSMGIAGGAVSPLFMGWIADQRKAQGFLGREQWDPAFWVYAGVMLLGGLLWLGVDIRKSMVARATEPTSTDEAHRNGITDSPRGPD
jgi:ACS family glucarate transporter-like MFS transporter